MRVNVRILKAALNFISSSETETRYYLNGVHIEQFDGVVHYTVTNGHVLAVFREVDAETKAAPGVIFPSNCIKTIKLNKKSSSHALVTVNDKTFTMRHDGVTTGGAFIDASFPSILRIVPTKKPKGKAGQFNPLYLAAFCKAGETITGRKGWTKVAHNGQNPTLVDFLLPSPTIQAFGVIMPIQTEVTLIRSPQWIFSDRETNTEVTV
jgi:hypothetical protein